jgi:hypothetical protein
VNAPPGGGTAIGDWTAQKGTGEGDLGTIVLLRVLGLTGREGPTVEPAAPLAGFLSLPPPASVGGAVLRAYRSEDEATLMASADKMDELNNRGGGS